MVPAALLPSIALIAGAAGGVEFDGRWRLLLWLLPLMAIAATAAWCLRQPRATVVLTVTAFGCCGVILGADARESAINAPLRALDNADAREPTLARLLLLEDAASDAELTTLRAQVIAIQVRDVWTPARGGVVVSVGGVAAGARAAAWRRGRLLEAPVTFRRPARYLNDGVSDFEREAALDGISLLGSIKSALLVDVVRRGTIVSELAGDVRAYVRRTVERRIAAHSELSSAIVSAVLIGDRSGLPDDVRARLQAAGTYHVIAISGGNIAILTSLLFASFVPIGLSGRRAALATLILLVGYTEVVTAGPSVWRATLVAIVYLLARLLDHRTPPWQAMAVAGGVLATFQPLDVRNAGFVLTFGATAALLHVMRHQPPVPRMVAWLAASMMASAAVELVLLPVMAETFSRITIAGLVLNVIAVPAMAVVQIAGLVVVCADPVEGIASVAAWFAHLGASAIVQSSQLVEVVPWLTWRVPAPSAIAIAVYYCALALVLFTRGRWSRPIGLVCLIVAAGVITTGVRFVPDAPNLRLTMLDVGQGDAMALQVPGQRAVMIDSGGSPFGGGSFDIGTRVVEPALWARGMTSLDALLLTHGDPDHIGGAAPIIEDLSPRAVWQGIPVPRAMPLQAVLARAVTAGIAVEERHAGEEFRIGAARVLVLHPSPPDWERQRVRNDDSVVLEVVYGDVALLLTGDIGNDVERQIVPRLIPAKIRVLKVAHHGSRTSTSQTLLDAWRPQIALISCGRGNPFGHPAPDVIARLEGVGARIYRTDLDGEITVETDGQHVVVKTYTGGKL